MGFDPGDTLRSLLVIKIKQRHDSYTDQISRIVVAKIFILCSIIISIDWFHDEMNCITPSDDTLPQVCWIQTMFTRHGSVLFRNETKPFHWSIFELTSFQANRMASFRFGTIRNRYV